MSSWCPPQPGTTPARSVAGVDVLSSGHEQVVFCTDPESGLRAVIAVHSTALGPALGGTRFYPYANEEAAVADALALSRAMTYKNSLAGLDLGGGKAVIIGDPRTDKSEALLRAYGRFVESLGGRYLTACDVGTYNADLDVVARETRFAHGRSEAYGGCGDSSVLTAYGVFQGMQAAAQHCWGSPSLAGRTVAVAGVGKVGSQLVDHLVDDGADVVVTDVDPAAVERVRARHPQVRAAADTATLVAHPARRLRPLRPRRRAGRRDRGGAARPDRLRRAPTTSSPPRGSRRPARRPRHPLRPRLPGERRRRHPGRGRAARLLLRPRAGARPTASSTSRCGSSAPPTPRASPRPSPPTGSPRSGCARWAGWPPSACPADLARGRCLALDAGEGRVPVADPCRKVVRDTVTQSGSPRGPSSPELGSRTP